LVIAFVEGENGDSWYWFLERLKNMVVQTTSSNMLDLHPENMPYEHKRERERKLLQVRAASSGGSTSLVHHCWAVGSRASPVVAASVALKQILVATMLELEAAKEELKRKEQGVAKLADLVCQVVKEHDDTRDQLQ
jgi:hypothetical protein